MAATNTSDWKAHPVMVAIIAGAATFAFTEAWIVPLHVQSLRNEIATNAELVGRAKALQDKVVSLEGQLKAALVRVRSLETPNLLTPGNPYPVGLGLVKLGQPITDLEKAYPGAKLKKEDRYWELEDFHSVFSSVVYYFEPKSNDMKITFIVFRTGFEETAGLLVARLTEALGAPVASPREGFRSWKAEPKVAIFTRKFPQDMTIMADDTVPNWWPRQ